MELLKDYVSLEDTLRNGLKVQVIDSMPYIHEYIPAWIATPNQLFTYLKNCVTYYNDDDLEKEVFKSSHDSEVIQTVPTLFDNDGYGDCDCFTVLTLAACEYLNFPENWVCLAGNDRKSPTHIYSLTEWNDELKSLDLTNTVYNMERPYKYKQYLKFCL